MRATTIMLVAVLLFLVHRWSTNQKTVDSRIVVEAAFAVLVIALLDQGKTEPVAKGFAWLFLASAAYVAIPTIAKASSGPAAGSNKPVTWQSVLTPKKGSK